MSIDFQDYSKPQKAVRWFDIDPTFDPQWTGWTQTRVYAYIPCLGKMMGKIGNFSEIAQSANVRLRDIGSDTGLIKLENLTVDQMKKAAGTKRHPNTNRICPIRVDKALLILYAVNYERDRLGLAPFEATIFLSAFNIIGLSKHFTSLSVTEKQSIRSELAETLDQSEEFASDLLKGNKVSFDMAVKTFELVSNRPGFKERIPNRLTDALETPSQKHTQASSFEKFSAGRLSVSRIPKPYKRPSR